MNGAALTQDFASSVHVDGIGRSVFRERRSPCPEKTASVDTWNTRVSHAAAADASTCGKSALTATARDTLAGSVSSMSDCSTPMQLIAYDNGHRRAPD